MANAFRNFFITITEKLNIQQIEKGDAISILTDSFPRNLPSIKIIPFTKKKSIIHSLKPNKSPVYCEITNEILKACASLNSHPLSYIYNHLLYTGIFPDRLKISVVKPLYKKGKETSMTNYRPIPLLTVLSKALKKAVHSRFSQLLRTNNILVTEQYGFRKGNINRRSCH